LYTDIVDLEVIDNIVYAVSSEDLFIADVSDVDHVQLLGSATGIGSYFQDIEIYGHYAIITDYGFLRILDVSDPAAPVHAGMIDLEYIANQLEISGSYVYVAYGKKGLAVIKLSE
jgi:hypothetical protein